MYNRFYGHFWRNNAQQTTKSSSFSAVAQAHHMRTQAHNDQIANERDEHSQGKLILYRTVQRTTRK